MCSKCGRWMEGKKRVELREICMIRSEKSTCYRKVALNMQKSAEAILAEIFSVKGQMLTKILSKPWKK